MILLDGLRECRTAVEAMKLGAYHFANKPFNLDEISTTVERALETTRLRREVRQYRTSAARPYGLQRLVGCFSGDHCPASHGGARRGQPGVNGPADW